MSDISLDFRPRETMKPRMAWWLVATILAMAGGAVVWVVAAWLGGWL